MPYAQRPINLPDGIATATLQEVGMDAKAINKLVQQIETGYFPNRHSLLLYKNQQLVLEKYFTGQDQIWGNDIGVVEHKLEALHDIRSISKSIVSACVGIAIAQGLIRDVHQNIFEFFYDYEIYRNQGREFLTVEHLLTMTTGMEWNEEIPYSNPENSQIQMDKSANPLAYFLSRPLIADPGTTWCYNGGTTEALAKIILRVSGMNIYEFAKTYLLLPMGIVHSEWTSLWNGLPSAAGGLRLTSRDLLKFGILYQNDGMWNGVQLVPKDWVTQSFSSKIKRQGLWKNGHYGYQFWIFDEKIRGEHLHITAAMGTGDQCIFFDKKNDLIMVSTAGNYFPLPPKTNAFVILKKVYESFLAKPMRRTKPVIDK